MKRLTNPKSELSPEVLNTLPIITHKGVQFREYIRNESYRKTGHCQCFKDCSCSEEAGELVESYVIYYRAVKHDGTDRAFYTDINYIPFKDR